MKENLKFILELVVSLLFIITIKYVFFSDGKVVENDNDSQYLSTSMFNDDEIDYLSKKFSQFDFSQSYPAIEAQVVEWIEEEKISYFDIPRILSVMIVKSDCIMTYQFEKLQEIGALDVETSDDGKLRGYTWSIGGGYNGYDQKLFVQENDCVVDVDIKNIMYGSDDDLGEGFEIHDFKFFTIYIDNKTYYLLQTHHMKAAGFIESACITLYTIENEVLVRQTLFETSRELLGNICLEYSCWYDCETRTWLFDYDKSTNSIYVPLVGEELNSLALTDNYLIYKWNGKTFRYIGVDKHWTQK